MANEKKNAETDHQTGKKAPVYEESVNEVNFEKSREVVDDRLEKLNKQNAEGHEKNMKAIEEAHKDNDKDKDKSDVKQGRADNGNTPRVNKDGSKTWMPPGVAGASR